MHEPETFSFTIFLDARDCDDILKSYNETTSGVYYIYPDSGAGPDPMQVWCDMDTDGGGWTVSNYGTNI